LFALVQIGNLTVNGTISSEHMALLSLKVDGLDYKDAYFQLLAQTASIMAQNSVLQDKLNNLTVQLQAQSLSLLAQVLFFYLRTIIEFDCRFLLL
jgi:hypothetical protein